MQPQPLTPEQRELQQAYREINMVQAELNVLKKTGPDRVEIS